jgi:antitoxin component YwqK of YwqJK toxin-antitoxin module
MNRYNLIVLLILILPFTANSQNEFDSDGKRTGPWEGYYPDGTLRYEAEFKSGKPVGLMKRYDEKGNLTATMDYYPGTDRCFAKMFSDRGKVIATGVYESQKKDSVWIYLRSDSSVSMVETYKMGVLSGPTENYYPSGNISQQMYYSSGQKEGSWIRFFESGDTMMSATHRDGMLHGEYLSYYPGGQVSISGSYQRDLKDGEWSYFSEEGEVVSVIKYDQGDVLNPEELEKSYERFIQTIEENTGNFPDPNEGPR